MQVAVCVTLIALSAVPLVVIVVSAACQHRAPRRFLECCLTFKHRNLLLNVDLHSLHHAVADGASPVKRRTPFGGALSVFVSGSVAVGVVALLIHYQLANTLKVQSILPAPLPLHDAFATTPAYALPQPLPYAPNTTAGLTVDVAVQGRGCDTAAFAAGSLLGGAFQRATTLDAATLAAVHHFACPDCAFGPLSQLTVRLPGHCQSIRITAAVVGAQASDEHTHASRLVPSFPLKPHAVRAGRAERGRPGVVRLHRGGRRAAGGAGSASGALRVAAAAGAQHAARRGHAVHAPARPHPPRLLRGRGTGETHPPSPPTPPLHGAPFMCRRRRSRILRLPIH
jgi:hypothetical protein